MIITDKFVFLHLPRTGGTFVTEIVRKFFPSAFEIGHHMPRELLPIEYSHLPSFGIVRNPWEFYVSLYHYILRKDAARQFIEWMTDDFTLDFAGSLRNLLDLGVNETRLDALIEVLPEKIDYSKRYIPNVSKNTMRSIRGMGIGYYTFRFNEMFGNEKDIYLCRTESLKSDLIAFFDRIGAATDELRDYILRLDKKNISNHSHYSTYYTPELAELVSTREHKIVAKFGYVFEPDLAVRN
jgi:hypothetical protein